MVRMAVLYELLAGGGPDGVGDPGAPGDRTEPQPA